MCVCSTFTPQIKEKYHCINVILHWLWNVNRIYALISVHISHYIPLKPYFKDIYSVIYLISGSTYLLGSYSPVQYLIW